MAKGLDLKFLHYGIRKEDLELIRTLCEKYGLDFDWMSEEILAQLQISVTYFCSIGLYFLV